MKRASKMRTRYGRDLCAFATKALKLCAKSDNEFAAFAVDELAKIGMIEKEAVSDSVVPRVENAYPAYFGSCNDFHAIRKFTGRFANLFLICKNGMHRYNDADHSMLTAMATVENIMNGRTTNDNIWSINAKQEYHEKMTRRAPSREHRTGSAFIHCFVLLRALKKSGEEFQKMILYMLKSPGT